MTDQSGSIVFTTGSFPFTSNGRRRDVSRSMYVQTFTSGTVDDPIREFPPLPRITPKFRVKK